MKKVAFESQLFLKGNKTGIAWCADNLIKNLAQIGGYEYQLNYFSRGYSKEVLEIFDEYKEYGIVLRQCEWFHDVWYKLIWPFLGVPYRWFFGCDCQITQFFNYIIPPGVQGKKVTIVHDMAHMACPETVRLKTKRWLDLTLKQSCNRADVIITVSKFSKSEIIRYMGISENKIKVMYPGVDLKLFHNRYPKEAIENTARKYGIEEKYILYLGTIEPRKNIQRLIEAYELLLEKKGEDVPLLVLAGGKGWLCEDIYRAAEKKHLKNRVLFTGYIDEVDSPLLLSGAEFFCFPSIYEGFGTPPVEAMACGTPVLAANVASMPEVLGDGAFYIDPFKTDRIADGMDRLLTDKKLASDLRKKGFETAQKYDWRTSARTLKEIYDELS